MKNTLIVLMSLALALMLNVSLYGQSVYTEDFNGMPTGGLIGGQTGWYDGGAGPPITGGIGLNASIGLGVAANTFTWTAHSFNWNDPTLVAVKFGMDFQASGSGTFDDDRIGWTTSSTDVNSALQFGVQLDNTDGGIATFWRTSGGTRIQTSIATLAGITGDSWYRLRATITRLTATSAQIDVSLQPLDASGNPTGTPITGTVSNTSTWAAGVPGTGYFTATSMWPVFKNYNPVTGSADNAYFEVISNTVPSITVAGTLVPFSTQPAVPSASQTYNVSGSNLTADISVVAPEGFELSQDNVTFLPTLSLTQVGGVVATTPVYVRLTGAAEGSFNGNITHNSTDAVEKLMAVSGTVALTSTANLVASADTWMRFSQNTMNYGGSATVQVSPLSSSPQGSLYKWNVSSIPPTATVLSASLTFYVTDASAYAFSLYGMRRDWVEGTGTTGDGTGASWTYYGAGTGNWTSAGAANTTSDRYNTNLWDATAPTFGATGSVTIPLNANGVAVVQGWIAGSLTNYGLTMQNYSGASTADYWIVASREASTEANRPKLNITYSAPTDPLIIVTGTLSPFTTQSGVPSPAQTYGVAGINLTNDISIAAPTGYQLSLNGTDWSSGLALTQTGGTVNNTTVYVHLLSGSEGTFNGDIAHTSIGATTQNVAVSGTVDNTFTATFQQGTSGYTGGVDAFIRGTDEGNTNFGTSEQFEWDDNSGTATDEAALIRFGSIFESEGGPIPNGSVITSAMLTYRISSVSNSQGSNGLVYESLVDWAGSTVTWNNYGGDPGAQPEEYSALKVVDAPATAANTVYTIDVKSSLQQWSDGMANYGWIILPGGTDGVNVFSNEHTTIADRPLLTVEYELVTGPYISAVAALTPFAAQPNVPSAAQIYTVSGMNLTNDIAIAAPTGFELSTDGTNYGPALTLSPTGGTVSSTTVYIRLISAANGSFAGDIVHTSAGATTRNVAVSGEVADGFAYRFGSGSAYITFGNDANLGLAQFTLETWFKREGTGTTTNTGTGGMYALPLVTKGRGEAEGSNVDMNYFLGIRTTDNVIAADFEEAVGGPNNDGQNHPVFGTTPIVNGVWYHAAATFDGTAWKLYLNGSLEATLATNGAQPRSDCIQHAGLGTAMNSTGVTEGHFDGVLDEVRVWSYARSLSEIRSTMETELASASGLVARWGLNEGTGTTVQSTAGTTINGMVTGTGGAWVAGSPMDIDQSPDLPTLIAPANLSTGVGTSPTLQVSVSDPEAQAMTVKFYGRPKANVGEDFTIIAIPDAQNYTRPGGTLAKFTTQTNWIVAERAARNIVAVAMEGDMTDDNLDPSWQNANTTMAILESPAPGIPYGIAIGNHDMLNSTTVPYNTYFGTTRFEGRSYYGGHYGSDNNNNFILFSGGGMDFIMIFLGGGDQAPATAALDWADARLKEYSTRRAIVVNHYIITPSGTFSSAGTAIFNALNDNPNLFLMLNGHECYESLKTDTGTNGNTIYSVMSDYQNTSEGNGWLRIFSFSPANNRITVSSYSPYLSQANYGAPYDLTYNMSGGSFALLGTVTEVASGSNASISWPSLSNLTEYEWYATVSDGNTTTTGPTWSFTTEAVQAGETVTAALPNTQYNFPTTGASMTFGTLPSGGGDVTITRINSIAAGTPPGGASFLPVWYQIASTLPANSFSATVTVDVAGIAGFNAQTNVLYYSTGAGEWIPVGGTYNSGMNTFTFTATHFTDFGFAAAPAGAFDIYLASTPAGTSSTLFRANNAWGGDYPGREDDWSFTGAQIQEVYVVPEAGAQFGSCDLTVDWNDEVLRFKSVDFTGSVFEGATTTIDTAGLRGGVHITATRATNITPAVSGDYAAKIVLEVIKPGSSGLTITGCTFLSQPAATSLFAAAHDALHGAYLGDVFGADGTTGDGKVDQFDLWDWSYAYWSGVPGYAHAMDYYKAKYDIGPTVDGYLFSLPVKDQKIDFEDLIVFAMAFDVSARHQVAKPGVLPTEPMDVSTGAPVVAAGETVVPVLLSGTVADLRGLSLELTGRCGRLLGVEEGTLVNGRKVKPIIMSTQADGRLLVDFALPATGEPCINAAGEVVKLRFEGNANVGVSSARARDGLNRTLPILAKGAEKGIPTTYALDQNYPNPFNPSTMVNYQLPAKGQVAIRIYDVVGREVATLVNDVQEAGYYTVQWNGRSDGGAGLSSGLYFCRMHAGDFSAVNKMLLVK